MISSVYEKVLIKKLVELSDIAKARRRMQEQLKKYQQAKLMIISKQVQRILSKVTAQAVLNAKHEVARRKEEQRRKAEWEKAEFERKMIECD